jgi:hypothetical protein
MRLSFVVGLSIAQDKFHRSSYDLLEVLVGRS